MSIVRPPLSLVLFIIALIGIGASRDVLAEDASPLDLVGDTAALCLEIPQPDATWTKLQQSQLAERLKAFPPYERFLNGPGYQQWNFVEQYVAKATGKPLTEQLLAACSDSLVVAIYLPPGEKPQGILIAQARGAASLKKALESWSALEPQHVDQPREHRGQRYVRRAKSSDSKEVVYHVTFERTLVLSDQESLVRQAIDLQWETAARRQLPPGSGSPAKSVGASSLYRTIRSRQPAGCAAYLYVNSRAWDGALEETARNDNGAANLLKVWQHVSGLGASLRWDEGVALEVVAELDRDRRPSNWLNFVRSTQTDARWSSRIPSEALIAISSRAAVRPLVQTWEAAAPEAKSNDFARGRRALQSLLLGRDLFDSVLPTLLTDWTIHATSSPEPTLADSLPLELAGSFSLTPSRVEAPSTEQPEISKTLDNALQFGLNFLAGFLSHQRAEAPAIVDSELIGRATVRWLTGLAPWQPAYGIDSNRLIVASTKTKLVRELAPASTTGPNDRATRLADHERRFFAATTQLVWLDSARLRDFLAKHDDWIAGQLGGRSSESKAHIAERLSRVAGALKLFDAAFLAASFGEDHVRLVLGAGLDRHD